MNVIWKGGTVRSSTAQWVLFGAIVSVIGLMVFILAALGLLVGALLVGILSAAMALASRRCAGGASIYAARTRHSADRREPGEDCVELGKDAYTIRIVDEKKPPA